MKRVFLSIFTLLIFISMGISQTVRTGKYDYESDPGKPNGIKIYTMKNGMKLMMSVNKDEPRIFTNIAVRAGSKHDPAETTGLAHYLEHMMFKGTSKIASLNWEYEQGMLGGISNLYEKYRKTTDPKERRKLYDQIDDLSQRAAQFVAANEYDKLVAAMGAKSTNAYTWVEQTVYVNDIPSNELERWLKLESERFREVVLRLFHTELEAVYEEYNINQDRDFRKVNSTIRKTLFPTHPYGTQTTIGKGEHLKNPSHIKIKTYFSKYYVPNNMAIVVAGDINPEEVVRLAEKHFGSYERKYIDRPSFEKQPKLTEVKRHEVVGQEAESVSFAWRIDGAVSDHYYLAQLASQVLYNNQCGLIDLDLKQKQKVLSAAAYTRIYEDYGMMNMTGQPREGQTLEEVEMLLAKQMEKLRNGDFPDWLLEAALKNMKLRDIRAQESNGALARAMTNAFTWAMPWKMYAERFDKMETFTKEDIITFANKHLRADNYVVVYKRNGEDSKVTKVDKPKITPVELNRTDKSDYAKAFLAESTPNLQPAFLDYDALIKTEKLKDGVYLDHVKNENNNLFSLYYVYEMGSKADKLLPLAIDYLPYLGTEKYSPEELKQELFKLGLTLNVSAGGERVYVVLSGLPEGFQRGVYLLEQLMQDVQGNEEALSNMVQDILAKRENAKKSKRTILRSAMASYARYGEVSPFTDILSEEELKELTPEDLTNVIKQLNGYEHRIFYYGNFKMDYLRDFFKKEHKTAATLKPVLKDKEYPMLPTDKDKVYFVDFPMVQAEVLMLSKVHPKHDLEQSMNAELYNNYFGFGLSSVVFQEIRESRALAYSAYAYYSSPSKKDDPHYLQAYVGTQADKLRQAVPAMRQILDTMPVAKEQIETARQSLLRKLESERITGSSIYWNRMSNQRKGYDRDLRKDMYEHLQNMSVEDLQAFQQKHVAGQPYTILVLGNKEDVDLGYLKSLGKFEELTLEQVFGY